ncbi:hypothetical protein SmJEL517_g03134 [Synchytrium microbalum]|uniref:Rad21/Rec8-like protein N-terminal domain-containing protein n=1 Tax=Synchytrium microbalum TaxID=1806994 RepID=A0A507C3B5_9FUNG|nr:uncharacterized protein SmJEL517_g03134 [Synchytrium microbalum]TPX34152.1 hypothetical protein SmJEL517_g03134 [Synchytrium microbalum]
MVFWASDIFTSRRTSMATIWLAATLGPRGSLKRLTKKDYNAVEIPKACEFLDTPPEPLALRMTYVSGVLFRLKAVFYSSQTRSNLLVGVARVYSQQWQFYLADVNHVFLAIRKAYGSKSVKEVNIDMPIAEARPENITVPINPDAFGPGGPFDLNREQGMDWLWNEDLEHAGPLSLLGSQSTLHEGEKRATGKSPSSVTGDPQSAKRSRVVKSVAKDSITLKERSLLDDTPDAWSRHPGQVDQFFDDSSMDIGLDLGFPDDALLQSRATSILGRDSDMADEVRRDHAEAAKPKRKRELRKIVNEDEEYEDEQLQCHASNQVMEDDYLAMDQDDGNQPMNFLGSPPNQPSSHASHQEWCNEREGDQPQDDSPFFFEEAANTDKNKKKKHTKTKGKTTRRRYEDDETYGEVDQLSQETRKRQNNKKKSLLIDERIALTDQEMRVMIQSSNVAETEEWNQLQQRERDEVQRKLVHKMLTKPILMLAPQLIDFYQLINRRRRWGVIPTQFPPQALLETRPATHFSSEQGNGSASNSEYRSDAGGGDYSMPDAQDYEHGDQLFAESEDPEMEMGRERPPTPQSGRVDAFSWQQQQQGLANSRVGSGAGSSVTGIGGGGGGGGNLMGGFGGATGAGQPSASFNTLEETPERFGSRRKSSGVFPPFHDRFSPLGDLPMGDDDAGGIFFPVDETSKDGETDGHQFKGNAVLEKDSEAFLSYALGIMKGAQTDHVFFFDLVPKQISSRAAASRAFYHVLTLANRNIVSASQEEAYADIRVDKI